MNWYKTAKIGEQFLQAKGVPEENIPSFKEYLDQVGDPADKYLMKKFIIPNPNITIDELKGEYAKTDFAEKQSQLNRLSPEIQSQINQTSQDKDEREWIAKILNEGSMKLQDLPMIKNTLSELQRVGDKKINEFKNFQELSQFLSQFRQESSESAASSLPENSYKLLENSDGVQLYFIDCDTPEGQKAMDTLAQGADWCVLSGNGKVKHTPNQYHLFIVDGSPEALVHPQSNQIKGPHDNALKNASIVKKINSFVEKHKLNNGEGDFKTYNKVANEIKEIAEKVDDEGFIRSMLEKDFTKFALIPEEKWGQYTNALWGHIGDYTRGKEEGGYIDGILDMLGYNIVEHLANHASINNLSKEFKILETDVIGWFYGSDSNLTTGRYNKKIPSILHTKEVNEAFNEIRSGAIEEWKNKIARSHGGYALSEYRLCPFEEVRADTELKEKLVNISIEYIQHRVSGYNDIPDEIKNNQRFEDAAVKKALDNIAYNSTNYLYLPDDLKVNPEVREAGVIALMDYVEEEPNSYNTLDDDIQANQRIQAAHIRGWVNLFNKGSFEQRKWPIHVLDTPLLMNDPDILEAGLKSCIRGLRKDPRVIKNTPHQLTNHPDITKAVSEGWVNLIEEDPRKYIYCPDNLKDTPEIQRAYRNIEKWVGVLSSQGQPLEESPEGDYPDPDDSAGCPKELRNHPEIQKAHLEGWIKELRSNPAMYERSMASDGELYGFDSVTALMSHPEIQKARIEGWESYLLESPGAYLNHEFDEELKNNKGIYNAYIEGVVRWLEGDPKNYIGGNLPTAIRDELHAHPEIKGRLVNIITGLMDGEPLSEKSRIYNRLTEEFKNYPQIVEAYGENKDTREEAVRASSSNRLNSSSFNDNYIGKLS